MTDIQQPEITTATLIKQLQEMVHNAPELADEASLRQQKEVLNQLFRCGISEANKRLNSPAYYNVALRAQSQFLRTLSSAHKMEADKQKKQEEENA